VTVVGRQRDRGQSTVELALALPFLAMMVLVVVQVALLARDVVAVQLAAREGARAASVSSAPADAAQQAVHRSITLRPLAVASRVGAAIVTVRVTYVDRTDVPIVGVLFPDVSIDAEATMMLEPP
jgi:Flp pilus assembly protein TadG